MATAYNPPALTQTHPDSYRVYDPNEIPDLYAAVGHGTCLEPELMDGECFAFQRSAEPQPGDFICLWWKPEFVKPGQPQSWLKRLVLALPPLDWQRDFRGFDFMIVVEQLNPHRQYQIMSSHVLAIHKCLGRVQRAADGRAYISKSLIQGAAP